MKHGIPWLANERLNRVLLTFLAGLAARGVQAVALLAQVPIAIAHLGAPAYGTWIAMISVTSFLFLADLGLSSSLTSLIAEALGRDDKRQAGTCFTAALATVSCVAVALGIICCLGADLVPWSGLLSLDAIESASAPAVFRVLVAGGTVTLVSGLFARARIACQEGYRNSLWEAASTLTALGGLCIASSTGAGLIATISWTTGLGLLPPILNAVLLIREKPWLVRSDRISMSRSAPRLIRLSVGFLILSLCHVISFQTHGAIISHQSGPEAAAEYAVGLRLFGFVPTIFALLLTPLWPAYRDAFTRGDNHWVSRVLAVSLMFTTATSAVASFVLWHFSDTIIAIWLNSTITPPVALRAWFAIWATTNCIAGCLAMFYHGLGWMRFQIFQIAPVALGVALIWPMTSSRFAAAGVLGTYVIVHSLFVTVPSLLRSRRFLRFPAQIETKAAAGGVSPP